MACAAANASRCAPPTYRAPTCSTARATRFWPPHCSSRRSSTRSRLAAEVSIRHWTSSPTSASTAPSATSAPAPCPVDIDFGEVSMAMCDLLRRMGKKRFNPGSGRVHAVPQRDQPRNDPASTRKLMIEWGYKAAAGRRHGPVAGRGAGTDTPAARHDGQAPNAREQVVHFVNKRMPGGLAEEDGARVTRHREPGTMCRSFATPHCHQRRHRGGVLLSGLRLGAALLPGGDRYPGNAVARRRADRSAAGVSLLWVSAARRRSSSTRADKITTDNRVLFHRVANTLNYLDIPHRGSEKPHLPRPVAGLQVRGDLPRLPASSTSTNI